MDMHTKVVAFFGGGEEGVIEQCIYIGCAFYFRG